MWLNCWLGWPWQSYTWTWDPFAVLHTSRQRPESALVMVPLLFRFHCWLACPLQASIWTAEAFAEPAALRHMLPYTTSCLLDV